MRVVVNGQEREMAPGTTVAGLVEEFRFKPEHIAIEINCDLVPRKTYSGTLLRDGDHVEIVTLVGGG